VRKSLLALAFALPPKIQDLPVPVLGNIRVVGASKVESLSELPIFYGPIEVHGSRVQLANDGKVPTSNLALRGATLRLQESKLILQSGRGGNTQEIWALNLGARPTTFRFFRGFTAATPGPEPKIVWLDPRLKIFKRVAWFPESEPVSFVNCDAHRQILVENTQVGLVRVMLMKAGVPEAYTLFEFTPGARNSEASAAHIENCERLYIAGSFGVRRVEYSRW